MGFDVYCNSSSAKATAEPRQQHAVAAGPLASSTPVASKTLASANYEKTAAGHGVSMSEPAQGKATISAFSSVRPESSADTSLSLSSHATTKSKATDTVVHGISGTSGLETVVSEVSSGKSDNGKPTGNAPGALHHPEIATVSVADSGLSSSDTPTRDVNSSAPVPVRKAKSSVSILVNPVQVQ